MKNTSEPIAISITENEIRNKDIVDEKLSDATIKKDIPFDPDEADFAGAFKEDAISLTDAEESEYDGE
ncbi:MAG: conjugal transfer protein TraD [Gilliamella sp.]|nr:conjugal transfer protein TraD [Gilliamella sp.]